ncbi:cupin domain-containing protein [Enterococcus sp. CWB-B31]|nr:cupin domain-containing protein [Enterococcus sp. CWB-B31]MCB5955634.1 cupin domain-containing protein [Enterococcus sp. CWB-B31]
MNQLTEIQKLQDSIFVKKEEGTEVNYFLYPEFEVHKNVLPSRAIQEWHAHTVVEEVIVGIEGIFHVESVENQRISILEVNKGDVVRVNNSIHRLTNRNNEAAEFLVFRFVKTDEDQSEMIKQDKTVYSKEQVKQLVKNDK